MEKNVFIMLDRKELEYIKNEVIAAVTAGDGNEWLIKLASKLIIDCETADRKETETKSELKAV